mmetsp:Transcript_5517/g.22884  ORF Transcript_5517/g.22884 Transcript_5517/m.22884 type:complete len:614 (-) Transcript_5517:8-1849(-)
MTNGPIDDDALGDIIGTTTGGVVIQQYSAVFGATPSVAELAREVLVEAAARLVGALELVVVERPVRHARRVRPAGARVPQRVEPDEPRVGRVGPLGDSAPAPPARASGERAVRLAGAPRHAVLVIGGLGGAVLLCTSQFSTVLGVVVGVTTTRRHPGVAVRLEGVGRRQDAAVARVVGDRVAEVGEVEADLVRATRERRALDERGAVGEGAHEAHARPRRPRRRVERERRARVDARLGVDARDPAVDLDDVCVRIAVVGGARNEAPRVVRGARGPRGRALALLPPVGTTTSVVVVVLRRLGSRLAAAGRCGCSSNRDTRSRSSRRRVEAQTSQLVARRVLGEAAANPRDVRLARAAGADVLAERPRGAGGLGEDDDARREPVKPVHLPQLAARGALGRGAPRRRGFCCRGPVRGLSARLVIEGAASEVARGARRVLKILAQNRRQRVVVIRPARVHRHRGRLVDDEGVGVVADDLDDATWRRGTVALRKKLSRTVDGRFVAARDVRDAVAVAKEPRALVGGAVDADAAVAEGGVVVAGRVHAELGRQDVAHGPAEPPMLAVHLIREDVRPHAPLAHVAARPHELVLRRAGRGGRRPRPSLVVGGSHHDGVDQG